jgi:peroxiredoxin
MLPLGTKAIDFSLPATTGRVSLTDFKDNKVLTIAFICNHCPYVKHILNGFISLAREYQSKGVAFVAINSNDAKAYPEDSFEKMQEIAKKIGFPFPYLYDELQEVAKKYKAACTPDFYIFDQDRKLVYRGQMDNSRPGNTEAVTGSDLRTALDAVLADKKVNPEQKPSSGCNIKWKVENAPDYFKP